MEALGDRADTMEWADSTRHAAALAASDDWARSDTAMSAARVCLRRMIRGVESGLATGEILRLCNSVKPLAAGTPNRPE
jgi:hypothetical protein